MSKEMLPIKLAEEQASAAERSIVIEVNKEKEKKREKGLSVFLMVVGLGVVALTSITVLAPVSFYNDPNSSGTIGDAGNGAAIPTALAASFKATDGRGNEIENNDGITRSEHITISGYSDSRYSTELRCSIDLLPVYCDGSPITIAGFPPGKHIFTIEEPESGKTIVRAFSWTHIPS
jgi:negative regulator of sigma E activity